MASVSSLDHDMRKLRLDRYTPAAANEIRKWIEDTLGERLAAGDLMEALKDGVALCKLINLAVSPGVRYKTSNMPFVQMENISHFLRACEMPPLNLPSHDRFLTVDLYDAKDPAQVLQCIAAFSRRANQVNPSAFPTIIGAKGKGGTLSPQSSGPGMSPYTPKVSGYTSNAAQSPTSPSGRVSPTKTGSLSRGGLATAGPVSSWSSKEDMNKTAPAWNIYQYGHYGIDQGKLGVSFGGRRQLTSASPDVPTLAEKEKRLKEKLDREKQELRDNEERLRAQQEADEVRAREDEERKWQEETDRLRVEEDLARQQEEARTQREHQARKDREFTEERMAAPRNRQRSTSDARLNGQFLSQYQATKKAQPQLPQRADPIPQPSLPSRLEPEISTERQRIADLERQLAELKQQQGQVSSQKRPQEHVALDPSTIVPDEDEPEHSTLPSYPSDTVGTSHEDDWDASERDYLRKAHQSHNTMAAEHNPPSNSAPSQPAESARPLPDPASHQPNTTRTSRYLASNPAPAPQAFSSHIPREAAHSTTAEVDAENARREASQKATRAGGWASKSLLEREMERERERQREWEENQKATAAAPRDESVGGAQVWNSHTTGWTGGDNQNRGGSGLGIGGARRQIIGGPRPMQR